jgi:hypothetical protein
VKRVFGREQRVFPAFMRLFAREHGDVEAVHARALRQA